MRRKDYTLSLPPFIYFPPSSHLVFYRLYCVISNVFSQSEVVYATTQDFSHVQPSRRHQAHSNAITLFTPGSRDIQSPSTTSQSTNPSHTFISPPLTPSPPPDPHAPLPTPFHHPLHLPQPRTMPPLHPHNPQPPDPHPPLPTLLPHILHHPLLHRDGDRVVFCTDHAGTRHAAFVPEHGCCLRGEDRAALGL